VNKFRKKPIEIEAMQWFREGDHPNVTQCHLSPNDKCKHCGKEFFEHGWIETLEGGHIVCPGDWIIKGIHGEFYPCKPDIFKKTYEKVEENDS